MSSVIELMETETAAAIQVPLAEIAAVTVRMSVSLVALTLRLAAVTSESSA